MENKPNNNLYKVLLAALILIMIITFSLQNNTNTPVKLWFWTTHSPLILLFLMCFIAGLLFAILAFAPVVKHSRHKTQLIKDLKDRIDFLEKQITK